MRRKLDHAVAKRTIKPGHAIRVWWSTGETVPNPHGEWPINKATVLAVLPYTGHFTDLFDCVLRLTAANIGRGWIEMAYNSSDVEYDRLT